MTDLFNQPLPPHQRHSETSRAAAESMRPKVATVRAKVWEFIERNSRGYMDGVTDEEIERHFAGEFKPATVRARRVELWNDGRVIKTDRTRLTQSGRKAAIWEANLGKS